ncbi:MAG: UvrD-helicase domain-containing protein, partial [Legionella sp.]
MLNSQQMAAVHYIDGPLLVLAGAGSGKTRVITQKIAYLINSCGYAAKTVCAVTFTNKAANEMRARIATVLPAENRRGLRVATFHTLGLSMVKRNADLCGLKKGFSIFDSEDCLNILRGFLPANKANDRDTLFQIQQHISRWKNDLLTPEQVLQLTAN